MRESRKGYQRAFIYKEILANHIGDKRDNGSKQKGEKNQLYRTEVLTPCVGVKLFTSLLYRTISLYPNHTDKITCTRKNALNKVVRRTCSRTNRG